MIPSEDLHCANQHSNTDKRLFSSLESLQFILWNQSDKSFNLQVNWAKLLFSMSEIVVNFVRGERKGKQEG